MFKKLKRRDFLRLWPAGILGMAGISWTRSGKGKYETQKGIELPGNHHRLQTSQLGTVGEITDNGFDPGTFMTDFDYGNISKLANGQTLREYNFVALDKQIEIAPGVYFPAWTYNGQVPGPTIRCREGDRIRIHFRNAGLHTHTIHFHGIHPGNMDGVFELVAPGENFTYEFDAKPYGLHLYHCHAIPLKRHIHKGLYGVFIVDPMQARQKSDHEFVMVMNAFDTNFDGENEVYAVNTVAFHYQNHPIRIKVGEKIRIYLVNITEFDPVNSFHLHAEFFKVYRTGTSLTAQDYTDTIMMCQAERHILEFRFKFPGKYMFHAHQSEFAELGWMGLFDVRDNHEV